MKEWRCGWKGGGRERGVGKVREGRGGERESVEKREGQREGEQGGEWRLEVKEEVESGKGRAGRGGG